MSGSKPVRIVVIGNAATVARVRKHMISMSVLSCVFTHADSGKALGEIKPHHPRRVLISDCANAEQACDLAREVHQRWPKLPLIMLVKEPDPLRLLLFLTVAARGILRDRPGRQELGAALTIVQGGGLVFGPQGARTLASLFQHVVWTSFFKAPLTEREREVLVLLLEGRRQKEICERLGVSRHTVHTHVSNAYRKLAIHSRKELTGGVWNMPAPSNESSRACVER